MAAENVDMHTQGLSPYNRPTPMVGLSPNLAPYSLPTQPYNFLSPPHTFPLPPHLLSKDDVEQDEAVDLFDSESASFSLYHSAEQDDGPTALSPISAASLSPPSLTSSASSVASVSSASPPPCSNCSCCSTARRLSALVSGLKQKTAHTQSLVAVYQQTQQRLQYTEQQLEQLNTRYSTLLSTHQQGELHDKRRREEDERRQVRLQAHESHIVQLKAALSKLQHEKDERAEKEKSIKSLQRQHDTLTKQTHAMHAQLAAMQTRAVKQEPTQPLPAAQTSGSGAATADDVEWLPDFTTPQPIIITEMPPAQPPTPVPAAAPAESESAMFDVSQTMALAEAAISALKAEVRKRNDIIRQMRIDQREYRKALKVAGITPPNTRTTHTTATRKRRRRDSKPDGGREKDMVSGGEMRADELDAFAADVMSAMTAVDDEVGASERVVREGMGGCVLTVDGQEVVEKREQEEQKEIDMPVVVKKRGRPRIHPIKEKTTPAKRPGRPRKVKTQSTNESSDIPQPSSALVPSTPTAPVDTSSVTASPVIAPVCPPVAPSPRSLPHTASAVILQQASVLLLSLLSTAAADEAELVARCLSIVCDCPCSSHTLSPLSSLLPPSTPVPFVAPVLPHAFSSGESCQRCLSANIGATVLSVSCKSSDVLHWDELSSVALRLLGGESNASVERWMYVMQLLDEALLSRLKQSQPDDTNASPSLLELLSYHVTFVLLSPPLVSSTATSLSLTSALLLHITRHTKQSGYVSCLLLSSYCSSQLSLSLLEHVALTHPQLLTHSPAQRTFHIKTMRLIAAAHVSQLPITSAPTATSTPLSSFYPALCALLSSELSSLSSASRDFVFGRLQSELVLHASVTSFSSPQQYQSLSASLLASFHLLFVHLSFPATQSMAMSAILPAIPKAKSAHNSLVLLLTLPSLVTCALHHLTALSQRRPRPRKEESYTRAQLAAVLHHAMEGMEVAAGREGKGKSDSGLLMRGGGCEVLLRAMDELHRRREVKALKDEEGVRVLRSAVDGWVSGLNEAEVGVVCGEMDEKLVNGWELLVRVKEEVRSKRQVGCAMGSV